MIELSCNSALIPNTGLDEILRFYRQIGIHRLELIHFMHGDAIENAPAGELAGMLKAHGMELIALYCRPVDIWSPERLEKSLVHIGRVMDLAEALGVSRIVFPPLLPREGYDYEKLVGACRRMMDDLRGRPIRICLENHHGWPMDLAKDYRRVLGAVRDERLGVALDTGHFTSSKVDMAAFIEEFAPRIFHVHIKDHIGTRSMPLGKGMTDNVGVMRLLRQKGYAGYASIELEVEDPENIRQYLVDAVRYCGEELGLG